MVRLNLLPPDIKKELEYSKKNAVLYQYLIKIVAVLVILLTGLGLIGYVVWNNQNVNDEEMAAAQKEADQWNSVEASARDFSERLTLIDKLKADRLKWDAIFSDISASTPANVRLTTLDFTGAEKDRIAFSGMALNTTDIGTFRELLSKSRFFQYVDIESTSNSLDPISGKPVQVFKLTMNLNTKEAKK